MLFFVLVIFSLSYIIIPAFVLLAIHKEENRHGG